LSLRPGDNELFLLQVIANGNWFLQAASLFSLIVLKIKQKTGIRKQGIQLKKLSVLDA
jgi:hypothetical protein